MLLIVMYLTEKSRNKLYASMGIHRAKVGKFAKLGITNLTRSVCMSTCFLLARALIFTVGCPPRSAAISAANMPRDNVLYWPKLVLLGERELFYIRGKA